MFKAREKKNENPANHIGKESIVLRYGRDCLILANRSGAKV